MVALAYLAPVFLVMALLVKLAHGAFARMQGADARSIWFAAMVPGVAGAVLAGTFAVWPVAVDCVVSAVALALLGRRYLPPARFEV